MSLLSAAPENCPSLSALEREIQDQRGMRNSGCAQAEESDIVAIIRGDEERKKGGTYIDYGHQGVCIGIYHTKKVRRQPTRRLRSLGSLHENHSHGSRLAPLTQRTSPALTPIHMSQ